MIVSLEPELVERLSRLDSGGNRAVAEELDEALAAAVRRTAVMRRVFYAAVLAVALYGTATGAVAAFGLPWWVAIGGIFALELGGVVFLSNADIRRRLGEQAHLSRLLGGVIAGAAATFNVLTHHSLLLGGFFALMSVLGFVTWWLDVENKRRDRLRTRGQLAAATPGYELWGHWLRHPIITARARSLAKAYPQLGLYGSLEAALIVMRREKRNHALAKALSARIRRAVGKDMAEIAALTFDMDEVARRLRGGADYDGLTALLGSELTADRVLHGRDDQAAVAARAWLSAHAVDALPAGPAPDDNHTAAATGPPSPAAPAELTGPPTAPSTGAPSAANAAPVIEDAEPAAPTTKRTFTAVPPGEPHTDMQARVNGDGRRQSGSAVALRTAGRGITVSLPDPEPDQHGPAEPSPDRQAAHHDDQTRPAAEATGRPAAAPPSASPAGRTKVTARILGEPALLDPVGTPVRGLRAKSVELLVYLAVHRDGAPLAAIVAALWPDVPARRAIQRLSTCLGNLRTVIRAALPDGEEPTRVEPVVNTGGHYHLDPDIIDVDWWQLLDRRTSAPGPSNRTAFPLTAATANLAAGCDYPWLRQLAAPSPPADSPGRGEAP